MGRTEQAKVHLPPWQRLGMMKRLIRFLIYLLTIGTVTAQIATVGLIDIENKVNARTRCARSRRDNCTTV